MNAKDPTRVLIVDDQTNWLEVAVDVLQREGYMVATASNVNDALAQLRSLSFQAALIDIRLVDTHPYGVQGLTVLQVAKQYGCKAIVLTGFTVPGLKERALALGADNFLEKGPDLSLEILRESVRSAIFSRP